jgi:hypothetical protein
MLADFFTKPLQGNLFRKFREVIMGHKHINSLKETKPATSQERVGEVKEIVRNVTDGRKTDVSAPVPVTNTYADAARKGAWRRPIKSERRVKWNRLLSLSRNNPIVRLV